MRIAVVSDTHGAKERLRALIGVFDFCDMLVFLGDGESDFRYIQGLCRAQTLAVSGNNDFRSSFVSEAAEEICGTKFLFTHGHRYRVDSGLLGLSLRARELGCKFVLYGHTHLADITTMDGVTFMNPGSLGFPRAGTRPSYGIIEGDKNGLFGKIIYI